MREINHELLQYKGAPGEPVTITVTPHDTTSMVNFVLDGGPPQALAAGSAIRFNLKNVSGAQTRLQLSMDFNHVGSYDIVVTDVVNCSVSPPPSCRDNREGPPRVIENFTFFVE